MTQEDKELLLKDICARLPYGVKINHINAYNEVNGAPCVLDIQDYKNNDPLILINSNWLPYLRSMSSMTKEEERELGNFVAAEMFASQDKNSLFQLTRKALFADFFNKRHIDYRGLIPMGLALEATEDMYKNEQIMEILNKDNCIKQCSCGCLFSYDRNDISFDTEQYWAGFWKGGWETRRYRYVLCPICNKSIRIE